MIGSGAGNTLREGHAPGVTDIRCYQVDNLGPAGEMAAVVRHDIVATNNSWGYQVGWCRIGVRTPVPPTPPVIRGWFFKPSNAFPQTVFGDYDFGCQAFDKLAHDLQVVIVFSAGNERNDPSTPPLMIDTVGATRPPMGIK